MAGFAACTVFSATFTRDQHGIEALWLSTGLLAAALLLLGRWWGSAVAAVCLLINVAAFIGAGDTPLQAVLFSGVNLAEAAATAWLARLTLGVSLRMTSIGQFLRLLLFAVAPAAAAGALLTANLAGAFGRNFDAILAAGFYASGTGTAIVLPAVLLALQKRRGPNAGILQHLAIYAAVVVFAAGATHYTQFPLHLLLFPGSILVAYRLGRRGVGVTVMLVTAVEAVGIVAHPVSKLNPEWTNAERLHMLTFIVGLCFLSSLAMAMALAAEHRLRLLWVGRSRIARRAEGKARAGSEAKDEFLATMSHEIRTPMNSIVGFADVLIKRTDLPASARRQIDLIARAGASLMTTVDDILTFSELQSKGVELKPKPYSLGAVTQDALAIVASAAKEKRLALDLTVSGEPEAPMMIDDLRVRQILLNLLGNAIKFTDAGRVRIDLLHDAVSQKVRFTVTDTGVGVPDDMINRLFKPFSQLDSSTTRAFGGAGLGLAIAKALVEQMGGQIGVSTGLAHGAAFWFEIPAIPATAAETGEDEEADEAEGLSARVLLVDDHASNRELGVTVLRLLGCEVEVAEDGRQAVAALQTGLFDLILMDVHMPHMDGIEATRAIRKLGGEAARTPIIAMSADVTPEMTKRCLQAGMADTLGKPVQIADLHAMLSKWIGRSADAGEAYAA
jgi:signal transduction histidine kinase/ActR/RegA family two-component response regulator